MNKSLIVEVFNTGFCLFYFCFILIIISFQMIRVCCAIVLTNKAIPIEPASSIIFPLFEGGGVQVTSEIY